MEEAETEEEFMPLVVFVLAGVEELLVDVLVGTLEVGFEAAGRLQGHLCAVLEHGDGEVVGRHGGEE